MWESPLSPRVCMCACVRAHVCETWAEESCSWVKSFGRVFNNLEQQQKQM